LFDGLLQSFEGNEKMKILMTGATGLIGKQLGKKLVEKGHEIYVISRNAEKAREVLPFPAQIIEGDLDKGKIENKNLAKIEGVVHLAGESVAGGRWNDERKKKIMDSRVIGTRNLIASLPKHVEVFVSASAIGYYGSRGDEVLTETAAAGNNFLAQVCVAWEKESDQIFSRVVHLRTGIVLDRDEGALAKMIFPYRLGLGGVMGSGQQWMSWIYLEDMVNIYMWAVENGKAHGVYNSVSPFPVTNREFSQTLVEALGGKSLGPALPKFALKMALGEMGELVLGSQRVSSKKIQLQGFKFEHEALRETLFKICEPFRKGEEIFSAEQFVPESPEKVFPFFAEAKNLEDITPDTLKFHIKKMSSEKIHEGTLIDYSLRIHGVPAAWKTRIDEWRPPLKFVDNQLKGPYKLWHHTHEFVAFAGGTLIKDRVRYQLPMGCAGWLAAGGFVRGDVAKIFAHRRKVIAAQKF
jgi:uncharacterized protein (TIGR01777 family)